MNVVLPRPGASGNTNPHKRSRAWPIGPQERVRSRFGRLKVLAVHFWCLCLLVHSMRGRIVPKRRDVVKQLNKISAYSPQILRPGNASW
jgi:hypothetical protein